MKISKTLTANLFFLLAIWTNCINGIEKELPSIRKIKCENSFPLESRTEETSQGEDQSMLKWRFLLPVEVKKTLIGKTTYFPYGDKNEKGNYWVLGRERERGILKSGNENLLEPHRYVLPFRNQEYNKNHNRFFKKSHKIRRPNNLKKTGGGRRKPPRLNKMEKDVTPTQFAMRIEENTSKKNKSETLLYNREFKTEAVLNIDYDVTQLPSSTSSNRRKTKDKQNGLLEDLLNDVVGDSSTYRWHGSEGYESILRYIDDATHSQFQQFKEASSNRDLLWEMVQDEVSEMERIPTEYAPECEDVKILVKKLECTEMSKIRNQLGDHVKSLLPSNDQVDVYVKQSPRKGSGKGRKEYSRNSDVEECNQSRDDVLSKETFLSIPKDTLLRKYIVNEGIIDWKMLRKWLEENLCDESGLSLNRTCMEPFEEERSHCIVSEMGRLKPSNVGPQSNSSSESKQRGAHLNSCLVAAAIPKELLRGFEEAIDLLKNSGKTHRLNLTTVLEGKNKNRRVLAESGPFKAIPALIRPSSQSSAVVVPANKYNLPLFYSKESSHAGR